MRPVVVGLALVIALLTVLGLASHHGHAPAAAPSRQLSAPPPPPAPAPVRGTPSGRGFTVGTVVSNDGATLTIHVLLLGSMTTVHADRSTKVLIPMHTSVSQLAVGSNIAVYGTRYTDGSLAATLVVGGF